MKKVIILIWATSLLAIVFTCKTVEAHEEKSKGVLSKRIIIEQGKPQAIMPQQFAELEPPLKPEKEINEQQEHEPEPSYKLEGIMQQQMPETEPPPKPTTQNKNLIKE